MTSVSVVETFRVLALFAIALLLVYPTITHARHVAHDHAIYLLTAALVLLAASVTVQALGGQSALSEGLGLAMTACYVASVGLFAREFVRFESEAPEELGVEITATGGGFDDGDQ